MGVRKSHTKMGAGEWKALLKALDGVRALSVAPPRYNDFVRVHVAAMTTAQGMGWQVHTMQNMGTIGRNFLAWHRWYLVLFERQLQRIDPTVSIPYWDWAADPHVPAALDGAAFTRRWGITRNWHSQMMPTAAQATAVNQSDNFPGFQRALEGIHGSVHNAVGGTMSTSSSPADPIFWLHHANVDRLWTKWRATPRGSDPPNTTRRLQPSSGFAVKFGVSIADVLDTTKLGYTYP